MHRNDKTCFVSELFINYGVIEEKGTLKDKQPQNGRVGTGGLATRRIITLITNYEHKFRTIKEV